MERLQLKGCGTALLTPYRDGKVDFETYESLVDRQLEAGIDFLVPLGTTAETPCLTEDERLKLLSIAAKRSAGRPVLVGAGSNSFTATLNNIRMLEPYGADAYLIVVPFYNKPTQKGIYEYYKAVSESTDKAIVIYNVPGRVGTNITAETTLRLAEDCSNIVAIKEASGNYSQISNIIRNKPADFNVLSGNDNETLSLMATGATGVISVVSNIVPDMMESLVKALAADKMSEARELHHKLSPLFSACFVESNPIPAKAAMAQLGLMENSLRLPLVTATDATEQLLDKVLKELGLK